MNRRDLLASIPFDPDPRYPDELIELERYPRRPARTFHVRHVLFAAFLGLLLGALAVHAVNAASRSSAAAIPASEFRPVGTNPHGESEPRRTTETPILDPAAPTTAVSRPAVAPTAELHVVAVPSPAKSVGRVSVAGTSVAAARSWALSALGAAQFACFDTLMVRESNWNPYSYNASSGAYGIPQAVPGSKMAAYGADWRTNPVTQVRWGIAYVASRYGTACAALSHSYAVGWY